ncbi:MAG: hypothetical protein NC223_01600 [Butyrivibrio sp.]|nr:hypothetical protein [Butyrivibrio sp.]
MKRTVCIICLLMLCLTGCGGSDSGSAAEKDFKAVVNGSVEIDLGRSASEVIKALGEPDKYEEAASCYFDGMDKIYNYGSFEIRTYPSGGEDMVQDVCIMAAGDKAADSDIAVGSSLDEVLAAYGEDYTLVGKMYKYYFDETRYTYFFIMDDAVKYFGYAIDVNN